MTVQCPLDFNFLLGGDNVYSKKALLSKIFRVMPFTAHNGKIVTVNQLLFIGFDLTSNHLSSMNIPYMQVVSPPPQVNYVATYHMLHFPMKKILSLYA